MTTSVNHLADAGELDSLRAATAWINSPPLTAADVRGKVVLIDIGTYTCINWLRTLPYVRGWAEKYKAHRLVVIGVHAPEFPFEHDLDNVRRALSEMRLAHPIAVDNSFSIWRAFDNHYWPARYLIDARGRIRHRQFGEGEYDRSERMIQEVLADAGARDVDRELVAAQGQGIESAADWGNLRSPENYLGYERTERFVSPGRVVADERRTFVIPAQVRRNEWALGGSWTVKREKVVLGAPHGRIACQFHGRDLNLVMGPVTRGSTVRFRVSLDDAAPGAARGLDVDDQGYGSVSDQRLYQLIRQPMPIADRVFTIEFLAEGVEAFAFTFG
jgi:thiol-disulfide isomerase/thioredoxin